MIAPSLLLALLVAAFFLWSGRGRGQPQAQADEDLRLSRLHQQLGTLQQPGAQTDPVAQELAIEGQRRLLAAVAIRRAEPALTRPIWLSLIILLPVMALATALYLTLGQPAARDLPIAGRAPELAEMRRLQDHRSLLQGRLAANPQDAGGWLDLASTHQKLGQREAAVEAARRARAAGDHSPKTALLYAELLIEAADGRVTPEVQALLQEPILAKEPPARFYLALGQLQDGQAQAALDSWVGLLRASPPDAPWIPLLRTQIALAATTLNIPTPTVIPEGVAPENVTPEGIDVTAMVARLADRLQQDPSDIDGWLRLGKSYQVLNQPATAQNAYAQAATRAPDRLDAQLAYAHALYPPGTATRPPPLFLAQMHKILALDPNQMEALWFVGQEAAASGDQTTAATLLTRLRNQLPADSQTREIVDKTLKQTPPSPPGTGNR